MTEKHEFKPAPWLDALVDQRLAAMRNAMGEEGWKITTAIMDVVVIFLTEPKDDTPEETQRWESACDVCEKQVPLHSGMMMRIIDGHQVMIGFGLCSECKATATL